MLLSALHYSTLYCTTWLRQTHAQLLIEGLRPAVQLLDSHLTTILDTH
jgi:hypothetical protein